LCLLSNIEFLHSVYSAKIQNIIEKNKIRAKNDNKLSFILSLILKLALPNRISAAVVLLRRLQFRVDKIIKIGVEMRIIGI
jgi:hypothetical protein